MTSTEALKEIEEKLVLRNYSPNTIKAYNTYLKQFFSFCSKHGLDPKKDAKPYILKLVNNGYATSSQNQAINAIKFYWEAILKMPRSYIEIDRPQKHSKLPVVLSTHEVKRILKSPRNIKHNMILQVIYGCGLRVSECINLKISDLDSDYMRIHIKDGKGNKDRIIPFPKQLLEPLREYYKFYKPKIYLFESTKEGISYSAVSIRKILARACKESGIRKKVSPHTLRHSYATHLLEQGINLRTIQVLMGHQSTRTTEIYTHITNTHIDKTPSPLDLLNL